MLSEDDFDKISEEFDLGSVGNFVDKVFNDLDVDGKKTVRDNVKKRKIAPTLDLELLVNSERGFSYLRNNYVDFVSSLNLKQDNELQNACKIVQHYREWHHYLRPKGKFIDFCRKIEAVTKQKQAQPYLHQLKDQPGLGVDTID